MSQIILTLLWIIIFIFLIFKYNTLKKEVKEFMRSAFKKQIEEEFEQQKQQFENEINSKRELLQVLDQNIESQRQYVDRYIEDVKQEKLQSLEVQIQQEGIKMTQRAQEEHQIQLDAMEAHRKIIQNEIDDLKTKLEAFRAKQETVNQEILRRRELEEQANFYRVCLSGESIADISLLQATRQKLKKPEIIDKIIYDNYVAKPVLEMIKRVLQNSTCSGIYKITCQSTQEIYIGKSTDIKNRWQQHCKTAFNCGTIASSILHRKMQQYGIENFTFELLEKVPKDQLSEREKYYIDFYKTKETGLNERNG